MQYHKAREPNVLTNPAIVTTEPGPVEAEDGYCRSGWMDVEGGGCRGGLEARGDVPFTAPGNASMLPLTRAPVQRRTLQRLLKAD